MRRYKEIATDDKEEAMSTSTNGLVVLPGEEFVWKMEPDRVATFKLLSEQTGDSVAVFEELIPAGFGTALHRHHTSDEAMCVFERRIRVQNWRRGFSGRFGYLGLHAEGNTACVEERWA